MPNWVINRVSFEGDQEKIDHLIESVKSTDEEGNEIAFDFNKIIPRPKSLDITSGGRVDMAMAYVNYQETMDPKGLQGYLIYPWVKSAGITTIAQLCKYIEKNVDIEEGRQAIYNEKTYGHRDWYSWCNANWGTKWNASDSFKKISRTGDITIEFKTAWSTPVPIFEELSKQHPEVSISIIFADEDIGSNCGRYVMLNGKEIDEEYGDVVFACEVWGYDPADYDESYRRDQQIDRIIKEDE